MGIACQARSGLQSENNLKNSTASMFPFCLFECVSFGFGFGLWKGLGFWLSLWSSGPRLVLELWLGFIVRVRVSVRVKPRIGRKSRVGTRGRFRDAVSP